MKFKSTYKDRFIQSCIYDEIDPITKLARHTQNIVEDKVVFMPRILIEKAIFLRVDAAIWNWIDASGLNENYF